MHFFYNDFNILLFIVSICTLKSCWTNVGPTPYLKENGWHYVKIGICRATGVGPTLNQPLAIWSARANVICQRRANKIANKMPTLAQRMIAIWVHCTGHAHRHINYLLHYHKKRSSRFSKFSTLRY